MSFYSYSEADMREKEKMKEKEMMGGGDPLNATAAPLKIRPATVTK
jgi:hypothetical protein